MEILTIGLTFLAEFKKMEETDKKSSEIAIRPAFNEVWKAGTNYRPQVVHVRWCEAAEVWEWGRFWARGKEIYRNNHQDSSNVQLLTNQNWLFATSNLVATSSNDFLVF